MKTSTSLNFSHVFSNYIILIINAKYCETAWLTDVSKDAPIWHQWVAGQIDGPEAPQWVICPLKLIWGGPLEQGFLNKGYSIV